MNDLIGEFRQRAIEHHNFGLEGDYKRGNAGVKRINIIYDSIKKQEGLNELLQLIYSDIPEVASLAATYCMKFNPEKCLSVFEKLSKENIPLVSFGAECAIMNWKNNEWNID
jgi:hypothetical protein